LRRVPPMITRRSSHFTGLSIVLMGCQVEASHVDAPLTAEVAVAPSAQVARVAEPKETKEAVTDASASTTPSARAWLMDTGALRSLPAPQPGPRALPTVNAYSGRSGCYIACYSRDRQGAVYTVGGGIWVKGLVRVPGKYRGRICHPAGYEDKDISAESTFKQLCGEAIAACNDGCWAGGDTGGWFSNSD